MSSSSSSLEERAKDYIPAEFRMFSGCQDEQTSADVSNVSNFGLPDPAGKAGGACTTTLLNILYEDERDTGRVFTFQEIVLKMREMLKKSGYTQIPQLSSSRPMDLQEDFSITPKNFTGTRRAVVIGINYTGMKGELSGCRNDAHNMISYIKKVHGFEDENITILMDDGIHTPPTRSNILNAYSTLVSECKAGDAVFCHYAGHGGKMKDVSGDEDDGYDETMIPIDYKKSGQILDDELFETLICPMPEGVKVTCIIDCCHSGTIFDLPFVFVGDGKHGDKMTVEKNFRFPHSNIVQKIKRKKMIQENAGFILAALIALAIPFFFYKRS